MSMRNRLLLTFESFLRVPPLLLMDEIFRYSFGMGFSSTLIGNEAERTSGHAYNKTIGLASPDKSEDVLIDKQPSWISIAKPSISELWTTAVAHALFPSATREYLRHSTFGEAEVTENVLSSHPSYYIHIGIGDWSTFPHGIPNEMFSLLEVIGCLVLFTALLVVFVLSTENLIKLYSFSISYISLYLVYIFRPLPSFLSAPFVPVFVYNIFTRCALYGVHFMTRSSTNIDGKCGISALLDAFTFALFFLTGVIHFQFVIYVLLVVVLQYAVWTKIPKLYIFLKKSLADTKRVRNEFGISHLIQVESGRLRINTVFRLFWCSKAAYDAVYQFYDEPLGHIFRHVVAHGTETLTGIIGLTVTVSAVCHQIGEFLLWILYYGANSESDANRFGSISTVLFFILSLQTGLTSLDSEKRLDRLSKNIVLLGTALFHALHQMLAPLLHAFRTFQALQIRAVVLSFSFLTLSIMSTTWLIQSSTVSTWSLAVLALAIEFKIKIIISLFISMVVYLSQLVQYPEFMQNIGQAVRFILPLSIWRFFTNLHDQVSHEDMVFYLKAFASMAEFITGIFLFVNAVWIFLFESASAIRAIGMSIHAYFNIWCESKKGWKIYCQRKTASMKIMSLADATDQQLLQKRDDVCSICYEVMESAKVTHCYHLFHAVCLRKWLYVQNHCPLCHEILYADKAQQQHSNEVIVPDAVMRLENAPPLQGLNIRVPANVVGVPVQLGPAFTIYNGIRFYDLTPGSNDGSDADADDESSDDDALVDEFNDATDNQNANGGLSAFL